MRTIVIFAAALCIATPAHAWHCQTDDALLSVDAFGGDGLITLSPELLADHPTLARGAISVSCRRQGSDGAYLLACRPHDDALLVPANVFRSYDNPESIAYAFLYYTAPGASELTTLARQAWCKN